MRKTKKALAILALIAMVLMMLPAQLFAADGNRIAGADRYETAIKIANEGWANGADTVILAPGDNANLVDALAAAPLAGQENAPILLTPKAALDAKVADAIKNLKAKKVILVGAAQGLKDAVKGLGVEVEVLAGNGRVETAAAINAKLTDVKGTFVVYYEGLADALSVASYAAANKYQIVLTNSAGTVDSSVLKGDVYAVGGKVKVSNAKATFAGADRYATNEAVVKGLGFKFDVVYVASGYETKDVKRLADALAGAPLAAKYNAPILLTNGSDVKAASYVNEQLTASSKVIALGGTAAVSDSVLSKVAYKAPAALAVESVTALNGQQIQVKFNQPVDKDSAENESNYKVTEEGSTTALTLGDYAAALQSDNQTVVITLPSAVNKDTTKNYVVAVSDVEKKDDPTQKVPLYTTVVTINDKVAPSVTKVEAFTSESSGSSVDITFSEPVVSGAIKIDGKYYASAATPITPATAKVSNKITVSTLPDKLSTSTTHTLEIVNLTDTAGNIVPLISQTFSVVQDNVKPTVSSVEAKSDSQILVTFSKKMDVNTVNGTNVKVKDEAYNDVYAAVVKDGSDSSNTKWYINISTSSNLYANKTSRTLTVVFDEGLKDYLGNKMETTSRTITLTKDTVAPTVTGLTFVKNGNQVTKIIATFSENVEFVAYPTVIDNEGVGRTSFFSGYSVSNNKITYTLTTPSNLQGTWTFNFAKGTVKDKALTPNDNVAYVGQLAFGESPTGKWTFAGSVNSSSSLVNGIYKNTITVNFGTPVKGGAVAGSATDGSNYSVNGYTLAGAVITLDASKTTATIEVPDDLIPVSDSSATFTITNVQNSNGSVIEPVTRTIEIKDNKRPVLESAQVIGNSLILTFNENMALNPGSLSGIEIVNANFEIKAGSTTVDTTTGAAVVALVPGDAKKVRIDFTIAPSNWDSEKTITIKTKASQYLTDVTGNYVKANVTVTATK